MIYDHQRIINNTVNEEYQMQIHLQEERIDILCKTRNSHHTMKTEIFNVCNLVMTIIDENFIKDSYTIISFHHDVSMMNTNLETNTALGID